MKREEKLSKDKINKLICDIRSYSKQEWSVKDVVDMAKNCLLSSYNKVTVKETDTHFIYTVNELRALNIDTIIK